MRSAPALLGCLLLLLAAAPAHAAEPALAPTDLGARVVALTNAERTAAGLAPLAVSPQLAAAARGYAGVLVEGSCFGHTCGPISDVAGRAEAHGYAGWRALGENIAGGQATAEDVVQQWLASPGHRANLLNPAFTEIGTGVAGGGRHGIYWVQEFGTR